MSRYFHTPESVEVINTKTQATLEADMEEADLIHQRMVERIEASARRLNSISGKADQLKKQLGTSKDSYPRIEAALARGRKKIAQGG